MTDKLGARASHQALAVPATPASAVDGPSGFDPSRLLELAKECERATDNQQRTMLLASFELAFPVNYMEGRSGFDPFRWEHFKGFLDARAYFDAAITLGTPRHIEWCDGFVEACCFGDEFDSAVYTGKAATPALALCAAALKARAASVDRSPQGGDRETGRHAKHESAVAKPDAPPPAPSLQTPQGGDS